ncbi:hypothetical protein BKA61DRAFT_677173 [Leptodontidium sp. MPI-SDFR-AT-0119]|nr:hypothetical protein BKA61DRAFT_677173 [Leptodontidium sp. MPI-SDFR-AT-0119]
MSASAKNNGMDLLEVKGDDLLISEVAVANIKEIDWKQAPLDDLYIPPRKKKAVPPSVGKTLTAELIAEHLRRPLMLVSAGELSTTVESVEKCLPRIFKRASRWKAVLLLDEADVLLEQRSSHDIYRNALVYVFLRTLEYY